ncbi:MAG TPA: glycosyltransferase, partial [Armatimonadota bacterium]
IYHLDETDVCLRMMDAGYKTVISDKAYVHHKSAPSSVRNKSHVMVNLYPVIRSQTYFIIKNNEGLATRKQIGNWIKKTFNHYREMPNEYLSLGMVTREECDEGLAKLKQGMMEGLIDGYTRPRQLIKREILEKHASPFKQFSLGLPAEERLVICFITQEYPPDLNGGIARFVHQLASGLARVGHDVFVVTRCTDAPSVEFEDGVWVHRTRISHHPKVDLPDGLNVPGDIWDRSYSLALEAMRIHNEHRRIDILESPVWDVDGIVPLLAKSGMLGDSLPYPDHFDNSLMVTSLHTTYKLSIPSHKEWTSNPGYMKSFVEPVVELEKYLFQHSDMVLANTQAIINEIESVYDMPLDPARLAMVAHGIDDMARTPRDETAESGRGSVMPDGAVNILFVGRLEERKGIDVLLESIPGICEKYRDVRFTLVGDDTLKDELGRTYKDSFLSRNSGARWLKRVCFTGKVSEDDLNYYYSNCDIFVAPSRFESFGLIFIEAMRFGKPVIGCRAGGMVEVIEPGVNGFLAEPGDAASLTDAIVELILDRELRERMGSEARKAFKEEFTSERMVDTALRAYREALDRARTANSGEGV